MGIRLKLLEEELHIVLDFVTPCKLELPHLDILGLWQEGRLGLKLENKLGSEHKDLQLMIVHNL